MSSTSNRCILKGVEYRYHSKMDGNITKFPKNVCIYTYICRTYVAPGEKTDLYLRSFFAGVSASPVFSDISSDDLMWEHQRQHKPKYCWWCGGSRLLLERTATWCTRCPPYLDEQGWDSSSKHQVSTVRVIVAPYVQCPGIFAFILPSTSEGRLWNGM